MNYELKVKQLIVTFVIFDYEILILLRNDSYRKNRG